MRELFFQSAENASLPVRLSASSGDFQIEGNIFEVGGANKRRKHLRLVRAGRLPCIYWVFCIEVYDSISINRLA